MNKYVLKTIRAILILLSLVLGFLSALLFTWIYENSTQNSQYFLDGVKFNSQDSKMTFTDAINRACSFSDAYQINSKDAMENQSFASFFKNRNSEIEPIVYCEGLKSIQTPSMITESLLIISQILVFVISAVGNTKIIQGTSEAVILIKRLNYVAISCVFCSLINLISIFYYSSYGSTIFNKIGMNWKYSLGYYIAIIVIFFPLGISATYWYEGVLWHNVFEQDRLQWQSENNVQQNVYVQVPTNFNTAMGGLQSPTEMARNIEANIHRE